MCWSGRAPKLRSSALRLVDRRFSLSELIQPLAATRGKESAAAARHEPSFTELVYAHFAWWRQLRAAEPDGQQTAAYHDVLVRFQAARGELVHAFWCTHFESAVALTERRRRWGRSAELKFHRESDWATREQPQVAAQLHRCDELAVRAQAVLTGVRRRICLQLVAASAAHLLSSVDIPGGEARQPVSRAVLEREKRELDKAEAYYRQAANGQAQIAYFAGMALVASLIGLIGALVLSAGWTSGVAAVTAGAVGAVVSVVQRINAGDFELEYDVGRPYALFLGGLRPLIGGAFALAISFAFVGGLLHLPVSSSDPEADKRLGLIVLCFLAGFSERWAQDTLATTGNVSPVAPEKGATTAPPQAPGLQQSTGVEPPR